MNDHTKSRVLDKAADMHDAHAHDRERGCPVSGALRDVARELGARADRGGGRGPAQVATGEYRDRYDAIFGKTAVGQA